MLKYSSVERQIQCKGMRRRYMVIKCYLDYVIVRKNIVGVMIELLQEHESSPLSRDRTPFPINLTKWHANQYDSS